MQAKFQSSHNQAQQKKACDIIKGKLKSVIAFCALSSYILI